MCQVYDLTIVVQDAAGSPVANASVNINAPGASAQQTGDDGSTVFHGVPGGSVHVTVVAVGQTQERDVTVPADAGASGGGAPAPVDAGADPQNTGGAPPPDGGAPPPDGGVPANNTTLTVALTAQRLRFSLFDFNPSFASKITFANGAATGIAMDTALLDQFKAARIDDYCLVRTISFRGENASHDPNKPDWAGFAPLGQTAENMRVSYMQQLVTEMHNRGAQVLAGYERVERGSTSTPHGAEFLAWLQNASTAQVTQHANDILAFFSSRQIDIDGIGFDFELNGLGSQSNHAANLATLFNTVAGGLKQGGFVYYDTGPFQPNDGQGSTGNLVVLNYALANGAANLIARPMCYNGTVTPTPQILASVQCALRPTASNGGGLSASHVQMAIDQNRTSVTDLTSICSTVLKPNGAGVVIYTMPGGGAQSTLLTNCTTWEAALNPGAPPPGTSGQPLQTPRP